jgi:hypothetical protein
VQLGLLRDAPDLFEPRPMEDLDVDRPRDAAQPGKPAERTREKGRAPAAAPGALLSVGCPGCGSRGLSLWSGGAPVRRLRKSLGLRPTRIVRACFASVAPPAQRPWRPAGVQGALTVRAMSYLVKYPGQVICLFG